MPVLLRLLAAALFLLPAAHAQAPRAPKPLPPSGPQAAAVRTPENGHCTLGQAQADLDVSNVRARLFNIGNLFWRDGEPVYDVPKTGTVGPIFAHGIWLGGFVGGELRMAGTRYGNHEFWPGPLNADGSLPNPDDCSAYDRIYTVTALDVLQYDAGGPATADLADWPVALGAPVIDGDGVEGNYDLAGGDRPAVYGAQTAFWVMNDVGNAHAETGTPPLGVEVRVTAFARPDPNPFLDDATFYRYEVHYRGAAPVEDFYYALFADPDLGADYGDDYIGGDSLRSLAFVYNADNEDTGGYGLNPPAFGFALLDGSSVFNSYYGNSSCAGDPYDGPTYRNVMRGLDRCGRPRTYGGDGYDPSNSPTTWLFTGVPGEFWSEPCTQVNAQGQCASANYPDDRRFVTSSGPHRIEPGGVLTFHVAMLWARGDCHYGCANSSVDRLYAASDLVQGLHDAGQLFVPAGAVTLPAPVLASPADGAANVDREPYLTWAPVPAATRYVVEVAGREDFGGQPFRFTTTETTVQAPVSQGGPYYWRVRAEARGALSPWSPVWSFSTVNPVVAGLVRWVDGRPAIVEAAGPGGADPCGPGAESPDGCDALGANLVYESHNSTGEWVLKPYPYDTPTYPTDGDTEVRFTAGGSVALHLTQPITQSRWVRVPFEVWDTGTMPGASDDRRLAARVQPHGTASDPCTFAYSEGDTLAVDGVRYPATPYVGAFAFREGQDYAAWAARAESELGGTDCAPSTIGAINSLVVLNVFPLRGVAFVEQETTLPAPAEGTVVRLVANKPGFADVAVEADLSALSGASEVRLEAVAAAAGASDPALFAALDGLALAEDPARPGVFTGTARALPSGPLGADGAAVPRSAVVRLVADGAAEPLDRVLLVSGLEADVDYDGVAEAGAALTYAAPEAVGPQAWAFTPTARSAAAAGRPVAAGYAARPGDAVAAFDAAGNVVGAAPVGFVPVSATESRPVAWVRLYGDDPATAEDEGLADGEAFTLRLAGYRSNGVWGTEDLGPWQDTGGAPLAGLADPEAAVAFPHVLVVEAEGGPAPAAWRLEPPFPNPLRVRSGARATVRFATGATGDVAGATGDVAVAVYDVLGRRVAVLVDGPLEAGAHEAAWEARGVASGVYVVRLTGRAAALTRKVVVLR